MFKFIKYVTLTEAQEPKTLTQTALPYGRNELGKSLSKASLDYHYGQLYRGYVDRYNAG
jgi:superoxide dismutase